MYPVKNKKLLYLDWVDLEVQIAVENVNESGPQCVLKVLLPHQLHVYLHGLRRDAVTSEIILKYVNFFQNVILFFLSYLFNVINIKLSKY